MKLHASRYGVTAAMCALAVSAMVIAADHEAAKWFIAVIGAVLSGTFCLAVIPYEQQGD